MSGGNNMPEDPIRPVKIFLILINDSPYGIERPYNGLRLAMNLAKKASAAVSVFMVRDGVLCAKKGQNTPDGYYNIERMVQGISLVSPTPPR
jgi:uncharacterized protein involved in oxidation of intracellular sulfur